MCTSDGCIVLCATYTVMQLAYKKRNANVSGRILKLFPLTSEKEGGVQFLTGNKGC